MKQWVGWRVACPETVVNLYVFPEPSRLGEQPVLPSGKQIFTALEIATAAQFSGCNPLQSKAIMWVPGAVGNILQHNGSQATPPLL
jgi:hypothetical protein